MFKNAELEGDRCYLMTEPTLSHGDDLPQIIEVWMAALAREIVRLGVYFRAASLFLEVPGCTRVDETGPDDTQERDAIYDSTHTPAPEELIAPLADALKRLKAPPHVAKQVLADHKYEPGKLPQAWRERLDRWHQHEPYLAQFVAYGIERVMIEPGMDEIDEVYPRRPWWDRWKFRTDI